MDNQLRCDIEYYRARDDTALDTLSNEAMPCEMDNQLEAWWVRFTILRSRYKGWQQDVLMFAHHHHHLLLALLVSLSSEIFEMCNSSWQPLLICFTSTLPPSSAFHFHFFTFFTKHFLPTLQHKFHFQASFLLCFSLSLLKFKTLFSAFHFHFFI